MTRPVNQSRLLIGHWPISNQYRRFRAERSGSEKRPSFSFDKPSTKRCSKGLRNI